MNKSGEKDFKEVLKKLILFGNQDRSLQDILLVYVFFSMIILVGIATIVNALIDIPKNVIGFDIIVIFGFTIFYILTNITNKFTLIRRVFVIFTFISIGYLWFNSQGSSGPSILLLQSLAVVLVFVSVGKEFVLFCIALVIFTIFLYLIEVLSPHVILSYESKNQMLFDNLSMVLLIFAFEIPVLIYARNVLFKEREEAISSAEEKSCFLAQMSHEIRTPMNAILGFVELLEDPSIEKEEQSSYLEIISQNSRMLLNLLNNAININKINSGQQQIFISNCNVDSVLYHVLENLKALNSNKEVEIKIVNNLSKNVSFEVDENLIYQILINLGFNALKFTSKGEVLLNWTKNEESIIFTVKDSGCGIPEEEKKDLFEKYTQAQNNSVMNPANGAGLGLHICKSLTELLNGKIWFHSQVGVGSEFFVKIPLVYLKHKKTV